MQPNEAIAKVKGMIASKPALGAELTAAWNRVCDRIEERALAKRPKPKSFEVHHETEAARAALMTAIAEGRTVETAELESLNRIGL